MHTSFSHRQATSRWFLTFLLAALVLLALAPKDAQAQDADHFGTVDEYSTFAPGERLKDSFFYSDDWFLAAPEERNDALALASMQLIATTVEADPGGSAATLLSDLGFTQVGLERFDSNDPNDCAYTWGTKTIQDGSGPCTLVAIAVQSYSLEPATKEKGWRQNFMLNGESGDETSGEHAAFARAADTVIDPIASLGGTSRVKYWICGQSRGGALADLIAARLPQVLGGSNAGIYAYTFEAPATVDAGAIQDPTAYGYIHNYLCRDDIVPMVPMWDMTRYGVTHELKTDETDAHLSEELEKLGNPAVAEAAGEYEELARRLVAGLEARVPTREAYSAVNTDDFTEPDGTDASVTYSYQETLVGLMGMVFGGELEGAAIDRALEQPEALVAFSNELVNAVRQEGVGQGREATASYWAAGQVLHGILDGIVTSGAVSLTDTDFYVLARLIGPIGVNLAYEPTGDAASDALGYLGPLVTTGVLAKPMMFSHHFDTLIARLKTLAPEPPLDDIDIPIEVPRDGDLATKAPAEVADFIESLGRDWLVAEAEWDTDDQVLESDSVYTLNVTLHVTGHTIPADLGLTINGQPPVQAPSASREQAVEVVRATWAFTVGNPNDVVISFDTAGHGEAPAPMPVKRGSSLRYVSMPEFPATVTEGGTTYRFDGWQSKDGVVWNRLKATQDMTVHATWTLVVDDVRISLATPKVGSAPSLSVPEDAPYVIDDILLSDSSWDTVATFGRPGSYNIECHVRLKDPDTSAFATRLDEYDFEEYDGIVTVNGEQAGGTYNEESEDEPCHLTITIDVTVMADEPEDPTQPTEPEEPKAPTYRFVEGDGQSWTKGSKRPATFVIKRSYDDTETYGRFTGIAIDGREVDASSYTAKAGSVVVRLRPSYLEGLDAGRHAITAAFDDGSAEATFKVKAAASGDDTSDGEPTSKKATKKPASKKATKQAKAKKATPLPKTADDGLIGLAMPLLALSTAMLLGGAMLRRRSA